jgi:Flp pilus assembly protein TadD
LAKNIATSGEVYAIYADARAQARKRDPDSMREAASLLRKALQIDPNYAPAWAELGFVTWMTPRQLMTMREMRADPVSYLKRALQLAPNLAHAHAALTQVEYGAPNSEAELRKAVALDPNDAEAWMWLGNILGTQNRMAEALTAHTRAVDIEPLFAPAVGNKINDLMLLGKAREAAVEVQRIRTVGDPILIERILFNYALANHTPGDALRILLRARLSHPEQASRWDERAKNLLQQLDFVESAQRLMNNPPAAAADYRGIPEPASSLWSGWDYPAQFWLNFDGPSVMGRVLPKHGRLKEYIDHYRLAFKSADDFLAANEDDPLRLVKIAPTVAVVLRAGGEEAQSGTILRRTEPLLTTWLRNGPADPELVANLAYFRGAEGMGNEAVSLLARAVAGGWLPDNQYFATDIANEPCFAQLVNRADFPAVRRRIFARIEEERRKVPMALLARTYPAPARAAA